MCEACCTPRADTDLQIVARARDLAHARGSHKIQRADVRKAERELGARLDVT